jgi:glycerol-3-phosphate cytidylyltransferase
MLSEDNFSIGITFGSFDLLHAGHVSMLEQCKKQCNWLIVGLQTDPTINRPKEKNKPVQTTFERWCQLNALRCVDEIIPYDTEEDLSNMLSILNINKRFIGSEYKGQTLNGQDICENRSVEIIYIDRLHNYSSSGLRKRIKHNESL